MHPEPSSAKGRRSFVVPHLGAVAKQRIQPIHRRLRAILEESAVAGGVTGTLL